MQKSGTNKYGFDTYIIDKNECDKLFTQANEAMKYTFPEKNKGFAVALLTKSGKIFYGASYTSDVHNLTMHSEAVALARAANEGETEIVAITGPNCHTCKQLIWESSIRSNIDTVILIEEDGEIKQVPISELMVYPWPDHTGKH